MKITNVIAVVLMLTMISSCSIFKSAPKADAGFAGNYEWIVKDTPDGDYTGTMTIKKTENGYAGEIFIMGMGVKIENMKIENKKMTGNFTFQDMDLDMEAEFAGDAFAGLIYAGDEGYVLTGKKAK